MTDDGRERSVPVGQGPELVADLVVPAGALGLVVFAHGSGSSRRSPRNREVAGAVEANGFATLLLDLLTPEEAAIDERDAQLRFDIGLLGPRVTAAVDAASTWPETSALPVGLFGASTGAAAALVAAAERPEKVRAVVSRGGRPDLASAALERASAPTLLIVGGHDTTVLELNQQAASRLSRAQLEVVPGATHLFPEPGAMDTVVEHARAWFAEHLPLT